MNDFDYDIVQKKRIARGATKKKNGSKSKRCSLPSDSLSAAERKKLNGELKVYDWSKPITWKEFKKYPYDIQEECLRYFRDKWGCSPGMFAKMTGVVTSTLFTHFDKHGLKGILNQLPTKEERSVFSEWLNGDKEPVELVEKPVEPVKEKPVLATLNPIFTRSVKMGSLTMSGKGSEIAQTLWGIFQNENVRMTIEFELLEDEE